MDPERARELLSVERGRVEAAIAELSEPAIDEDAVHTDPAEDAPALVEEGVDFALAETLREQFAAIERAERRLAEGTYGRSIISGEQIPDGRLEAIPWAERTAEEQALHESS